jgi:hypothetical protein
MNIIGYGLLQNEKLYWRVTELGRLRTSALEESRLFGEISETSPCLRAAWKLKSKKHLLRQMSHLPMGQDKNNTATQSSGRNNWYLLWIHKWSLRQSCHMYTYVHTQKNITLEIFLLFLMIRTWLCLCGACAHNYGCLWRPELLNTP